MPFMPKKISFTRLMAPHPVLRTGLLWKWGFEVLLWHNKCMFKCSRSTGNSPKSATSGCQSSDNVHAHSQWRHSDCHVTKLVCCWGNSRLKDFPCWYCFQFQLCRFCFADKYSPQFFLESCFLDCNEWSNEKYLYNYTYKFFKLIKLNFHAI